MAETRSLFGFEFKRKSIETNKKPVSFTPDNEDGAYEISPTDTQHEYTIYVKNEMGVNVDGALAYGIEDRTKVTNVLLTRHGQYITKIEHHKEK